MYGREAGDPFPAGFFIKIAAAERHLSHYQWIGVESNIFRAIDFT
jgi:hypothetical protein